MKKKHLISSFAQSTYLKNPCNGGLVKNDYLILMNKKHRTTAFFTGAIDCYRKHSNEAIGYNNLIRKGQRQKTAQNILKIRNNFEK